MNVFRTSIETCGPVRSYGACLRSLLASSKVFLGHQSWSRINGSTVNAHYRCVPGDHADGWTCKYLPRRTAVKLQRSILALSFLVLAFFLTDVSEYHSHVRRVQVYIAGSDALKLIDSVLSREIMYPIQGFLGHQAEIMEKELIVMQHGKRYSKPAW